MTAPLTCNLDALIRNPDSIPWEEHRRYGRVGARIHRLYRNEETGQQVALVHCAPGATAQAHRHEGHESFLILDGGMQDEHGSYKKGDLVVYEPGTQHSWSSPEGALIYATWGGPVVSTMD